MWIKGKKKQTNSERGSQHPTLHQSKTVVAKPLFIRFSENIFTILMTTLPTIA